MMFQCCSGDNYYSKRCMYSFKFQIIYDLTLLCATFKYDNTYSVLLTQQINRTSVAHFKSFCNRLHVAFFTT